MICSCSSAESYGPSWKVNMSSCLHSAAWDHPELRLLEPAGGHERISRHGGLQDKEVRGGLRRSGFGWCRLVYVPAEGRRLPAGPGLWAWAGPHWHSPGEAEEAAASHARSAPRTAAVQVGHRAGRGRCGQEAEKGTLRVLFLCSCLVGIAFFSYCNHCICWSCVALINSVSQSLDQEKIQKFAKRINCTCTLLIMLLMKEQNATLAFF